MYNFHCDSNTCKCKHLSSDNKVVVIVETIDDKIIAIPGTFVSYGSVLVDLNSSKESIRLDEFKPFWNAWKQVKPTDILGLRAYCEKCYSGILINPELIKPSNLKTIGDFYPSLNK